MRVVTQTSVTQEQVPPDTQVLPQTTRLPLQHRRLNHITLQDTHTSSQAKPPTMILATHPLVETP